MTNIFNWDPDTAANNDDADAPTVSWIEGQLASTVNNSARGMMMRVAQFIYDTSGALKAGGTGNAYTVTTKSGAAAYGEPLLVAFESNRDCAAGAVTLNINGLGAKNLYNANGVKLDKGDIRTGGVYYFAYNVALDGFVSLNIPSAPRWWRMSSPTITLPHNVTTRIDTFAVHDEVMPNSSINSASGGVTIGAGDEGVYTITAGASLGTTNTIEECRIILNGEAIAVSSGASATDVGPMGKSVSTVQYLNVGDVVYMTYYQVNSTSSSRTISSTPNSHFAGVRSN